MKNKFLAVIFLAFSLFFTGATGIEAQQSSVSFNKKGISVIFKIQTTSPDSTKQTFGSVYFTGYDETEKESRIHRVLADRESGAYFGYDLVIENDAAPNKFKVSIKPLSINPPEQLRLADLTARSLPKYPEDMIVEEGDTIALDLLVNPQTKVKIVDLIKITAKKPSSSDSSLFNSTTVGSGNGKGVGTGVGRGVGTGVGVGVGGGFGSRANDSLFTKERSQDFTLNDVKLRLTAPKLLVNGTVSTNRGSEWNGIIEGSVVYLYIPERGRFIFSLFPRQGFNFQKNGAIENNKISFQSGGDLLELISNAPILSGGGNWSLWTFNDENYKPDSTFTGASGDYIQYGAAEEAEYLLTRKPQRRPLGVKSGQGDTKAIYKNWLEKDVAYIISETEKQIFLQLNTDEEREQFIQSFWERRDTRPDTKENEFRSEYYGRIVFANQNFTVDQTAGWLTDRGRIFIKYGKPDEVQKNESGEVWVYKSLPELGDNARFEFVDAAKNGNFRLRQ